MATACAVFGKIPMSRNACTKWLASCPGKTKDFDDWRTMNPVMASSYEELQPSFFELRKDTLLSQFQAYERRSDYFCYEYDDYAGAFYLADVAHSVTLTEITVAIAALRTAASFMDREGPGFIYVYPALSGGDPEALLRITPGESKFIHFSDLSPEALYFIDEAEEFIEALLEEDTDA